jgi:class 3 adenylate cyclase/tetratricopeptide (TPR) repeat protein
VAVQTTGVEGLAAYVPRMLLARPAAEPQWWEADGTLVFADISGFTRLSERLARQGRAGAEQLVTALSEIFTSLLGASDDGGDLLKFGGDALLLFYEGEDHARRACHAASAMQRALRRVGGLDTPQGRVRLRMSVGVHSGRVPFLLVGGEHLELVVTGEPASTTVAMESAAQAGEVLVSPATAALLPPAWLRGEQDGGVLLGRVPALPGLDAIAPPIRSDPLRFIPVPLRDHLARGADHDHRQVTVGFLHFAGVDDLVAQDGPAAAFARVQALTEAVQAAMDDHGVCIICADIGVDGGKLMLTCGAPLAIEDHEAAMLRACRQVLAADVGLDVRIGVNRGHVFSGDVGAPFRRTYSTMGDAVNLAARIMGRAPVGGLLAHRTVLERSAVRFAAEPVPPFAAKGKSALVEAALVGPPLADRPPAREPALPLVGRDAEVARLAAAVAGARQGRGAVVQLVGEEGMGKSRLAARALALAAEVGLPARTVTCTAYEGSSAYAVADRLLRGVLGIADDATPEAAGAALTALVADRAPDLAPWLPLLALPIGARVGPTPEVDDLDARFRLARLHHVVAALLDAVAEPATVVVEDVHWIDEASGDLLVAVLAEAARPWAVVLTSRPDGQGPLAVPGAERHHLDALPHGAALALAVAVAGDAPLPARRTDELVRRAAGNPLFLIELVAAADQHGEALPETVEALLAARVDRLPPADREALRCLAVLGSRFPAWLVDAALGDLGLRVADADLWERLSGFVVVDGDEGAFRHDLARITAYEGLTFARRAALHGRVASALEAGHGAREAPLALVALHNHRAQRWAWSWAASRTAAEQARAASANVEAAELYEQALAAASLLPEVPACERAAVAESLGDVAEVAARYDTAAAAYRQARAELPDDVGVQARLWRREAVVLERSGRYPVALRALKRGLQHAAALPDGPSRAEEEGRLAVAYGGVRVRQGKLREASTWLERGIASATAAGDDPTLAHAWSLLATVHTDLGLPSDPVHRALPVTIYEALGDLVGLANVLNNLGIAAYFEGRWAEALSLYERSRVARERAGDVMGAATAANNIAEILSDQGDLEGAEALLREALRAWAAAAYPLGVAAATSNLGRVAARAGRLDEALATLDDAARRCREIGIDDFLLETTARRAEALLAAGRCVEAWEAATEVLAGCEGDEAQPLLVAMVHRLRGLALVQGGSPARGRAVLRESLAVARDAGAPYEVALTLEALGGLERAPDLLVEAAAIFRELGVVRAHPPVGDLRLEPAAPPAAPRPAAAPAGIT